MTPASDHVFAGLLGALVPTFLKIATGNFSFLVGPYWYACLLAQVVLGLTAVYLFPSDHRTGAFYHGATGPALFALVVKTASQA